MLAADKQPRSDLYDDLTRHAVASIKAADYFAKPFPHIFFRNFFPDEFYSEMIAKWPTTGYDPIKGDGTRMALRLYGDHVRQVDAPLRDAWVAVSQMLMSKDVENAIRVKLRDGLETRARGDKLPGADAVKLVAKPVLYSDKDGYEIKPHPDGRKKVVTMQLYCPADRSQENLGTTLYQASVKGALKPSSYFLEPVKTLPFLPNVGYAFVVLKWYHSLLGMSWHGRPKITTTIDKPRVSILNTFYVSEEAGF